MGLYPVVYPKLPYDALKDFAAVGQRTHVQLVIEAMGRRSDKNLGEISGDIQRMELVVTNPRVLRRPLRNLDLMRRTGVTIARVIRAGVNLVPTASLRLVFADRVVAVGPEAGLKLLEAELGNSVEVLNRPQLIPIFLGIVAGVIVGSIPLTMPGLNTTLRIGLAGGPLLAAIALSQLGNIGSVVWYMPSAANQLFRDFGLAVFLACVGFQAGNGFLEKAATSSGLALLIAGIAVTTLPVFTVACFCLTTSAFGNAWSRIATNSTDSCMKSTCWRTTSGCTTAYRPYSFRTIQRS